MSMLNKKRSILNFWSLGEAPKTDLLEGVELPEMPPRKKFDRKMVINVVSVPSNDKITITVVTINVINLVWVTEMCGGRKPFYKNGVNKRSNVKKE